MNVLDLFLRLFIPPLSSHPPRPGRAKDREREIPVAVEISAGKETGELKEAAQEKVRWLSKGDTRLPGTRRGRGKATAAN